MGMLSKGAGRNETRIFGGSGACCRRSELPEKPKPAFTQHSFRFFRTSAENPSYGAIVVRDRAVGKRKVCFLGIAVPLHQQKSLVIPRALAFAQHSPGLGTNRDIPNLMPQLWCGGAQGSRMTGAQHWNIRIVIDIDVLGTPPDEHRITGMQHDPDRRFQAVRPILEWPERGRGPIEGADAVTHFSAAKPEVRKGCC